MPITYPLSLPTESGFVDFRWLADSAVAVQEGEFLFNTKKYAWDGFIRRATMTVGSLTRAQAKAWEAWYLRLNVREGTFLLQDPIGAAIAGAYNGSGTPAVQGGNQTGPDLVTDGWPNSVTGLLKAGDYIAILGRLYQLTSDASSNGSGVATLEVWPHATLRLTDNAAITVGTAAFGKFSLESPSEFPRNVEDRMEGFTLNVREDFL